MSARDYSFDMLKNYPTARKYLIKKPLKTSALDSLKELIFGKK
jgi:hypothetical protein